MDRKEAIRIARELARIAGNLLATPQDANDGDAKFLSEKGFYFDDDPEGWKCEIRAIRRFKFNDRDAEMELFKRDGKWEARAMFSEIGFVGYKGLYNGTFLGNTAEEAYENLKDALVDRVTISYNDTIKELKAL